MGEISSYMAWHDTIPRFVRTFSANTRLKLLTSTTEIFYKSIIGHAKMWAPRSVQEHTIPTEPIPYRYT
jgi:hypothetical protein